MCRWVCEACSSQEGEVSPDVAQVRPFLLQDHPHAVSDGRVPVAAAPRVVALLGEQVRRCAGQELGHHLLPFGSHREGFDMSIFRTDESAFEGILFAPPTKAAQGWGPSIGYGPGRARPTDSISPVTGLSALWAPIVSRGVV